MKSTEEIIAQEIDAISIDYWYDGLSWESHLTDQERQRAYDAVFGEMLRVGRDELGYQEPYIHHNGNGHYVVVEGKK